MTSLLRGAALFFLSPLTLLALLGAITFGAEDRLPGCIGCIVGTLVFGGCWAWAKASEWSAGWRDAKIGGRR